MTLADRLTLALAQLGDTQGSIVAAMRCLGIRGVRSESCMCPVAIYLARVTGGHWVSVVGHWVRIGGINYALPAPVRAFIVAFDRGAYPELENPL